MFSFISSSKALTKGKKNSKIIRDSHMAISKKKVEKGDKGYENKEKRMYNR